MNCYTQMIFNYIIEVFGEYALIILHWIIFIASTYPPKINDHSLKTGNRYIFFCKGKVKITPGIMPFQFFVHKRARIVSI